MFGLWSLWLTWPVPLKLSTRLPLGTEAVQTVPLFNLWTVGWNAERAQRGFVAYGEAPIFYPTRGTFYFSEAQPTTVVVAPLIWATGNPLLGYNVYLLVTLALNGALTYRLFRQVGLDCWASVIGGLLAECLPFAIWQLGVLQLVAFWPTVWTLSAWWRICRQGGGWRSGLELGLAYAVTYLACNYYGLFLTLLLVPAGFSCAGKAWRTQRFWVAILLGALLAGGLLGPLVSKQLAIAREQAWERELMTVIGLSAHLRDYTDTPWPQWLDHWESREPGRLGWTLGPAWLCWVMAAVGLVSGLCRASQRRWTLFLLVFTLAALFYSLGPRTEFWGFSPYIWLWATVPGVKQIRSPFRFALFVQFGAVAFAGLGLNNSRYAGHWLRERVPAAWQRWCPRWCLPLPVVVLGLCLLLETRPRNGSFVEWSYGIEEPPWVTYLREETPPEAIVVCLPFGTGASVGDYEATTAWMAEGLAHHRRMVNGYSGYFPQPFLDLREALAMFPQSGGDALLAAGVSYAVVVREDLPTLMLLRSPGAAGWEWLFSDDVQGVDIYRLPLPAEPARSAPAEQPSNKDAKSPSER